MEPLVSVIIPAYRCAATIGKAIDSALLQESDFTEGLEILIIADVPDPELDTAMKAYEGKSEIRFYQNETPLGAGGSRNRGVSLAKGAYVAFLDADDWWEKGKLKKQMAILTGEGAPVLCCTARELVTQKGETTGRVIPVKEKITYRQLLMQNCINCSSVVIRRDVALEFPMEHEDSHEDYITWLKVLKKYGYAVAVNEPLLKYRQSAEGKSGGKLKSARMTYRAYRYAGFGRAVSGVLFISYAVNGAFKYAGAYLFRREIP